MLLCTWATFTTCFICLISLILKLNHKITKITIRKHKALTLSDDIRLNITVIVLTSPHESSIRLESLGYHIVNKPVLIPDTLLIECLLVFAINEEDFELVIKEKY